MQDYEQQKLPKVATKSSIKLNVEAGKKYFWCSCGLSQDQPFCDGSHKGTDFRPVIFEAKKDELISFCGCKQSNKGMFCDGSHRKI